MPIQHSNYFSIGGLIFLVILSKNEENREEKKRKEGETKMESKLKKYEKKERKQLVKSHETLWELNHRLLPPQSVPPLQLSLMKPHFREIWPRSQGSLSSAPNQGLLYLAVRGKLPEFSIPSNSKTKRLNLNSWWVWLRDLGFPSSPQPLPTHSWLYPRSHSPRILRFQPPLLHLTHQFRPGRASWSSTCVQQPKQWLRCPECRGVHKKKFQSTPQRNGLYLISV